ncbi:transcriptional regulator, TetR family (plasmid) [Rippkaea orientalis PCC 8801]|uniref:Transcriptional regulator, TetR family n=1 Tax=Rippkaea orientalis (strain PCC 8801 / RF-1) TaxID=41431 RepID=B7K6I1_RIPO1|nr:TetR/AcrR family transcriptional regulator [Rippkaea orientalis]ACK68403.1 transcriptional regulator, TetR family [Rippkaea orientalis PCC 8801]
MGLEQYRAEVSRQKQQAILQAALTAFLEFGYDRTTIDYVAQKAQVSTATLYKHFPSKADLFGGIMAQVWRTDQISSTPVSPSLSPQTALMQIGQEYAQLLMSANIQPLFRVVIAETSRFPELGTELYHRGKEPFLKRLHAYLQAQVALDTLVIVNIPLASRQFLGMINDIIFWPRFLIMNLEISENEIEDVIISAVETFLARYANSC